MDAGGRATQDAKVEGQGAPSIDFFEGHDKGITRIFHLFSHWKTLINLYNPHLPSARSSAG